MTCLQTIFEINSTGRSSSMAVMKQKREHHDRVIARQQLCESLKTVASDAASAGRQGDGVVTVLSTDNELQVRMEIVVYFSAFLLRKWYCEFFVSPVETVVTSLVPPSVSNISHCILYRDLCRYYLVKYFNKYKTPVAVRQQSSYP